MAPSALLGAVRVCENAPLAPLTSFRVGGPADLLAEARSADELAGAWTLARERRLPVTLLGGGSNVLIGDRGIRGLVLRVHGGEIRQVAPDLVRAEAGVTINALVRWTIHHGLGGLAAWAGTPGTVGGAIHGNAHFAGELIGARVVGAAVLGREGAVRELPAAELELGYDQSRLQRTGEALLWAEFRVQPEPAAALRQVARASLALRKRTQPLALPSAGCVFRNPDAAPAGLPASAGALIDAAGLKGRAVGAARVSPVHANFIVNEGGATARDVAALIELVRDAVAARFGVELREEIVRLGEF